MTKIEKKQLLEKINEKDFLSIESRVSNLLDKLNGLLPLTEEELRAIVSLNLPLENLDVSEITNIDNLFKYKIVNSDISNWDTKNIESMNGTFYKATINCDLSNWNTSSLSSLTETFVGAYKDFGFSKWNVSKVKDLNGAFMYCSIEHLDLSDWNVENVEIMDDTFADYGCQIIEKDGEEIAEEIKDKSFNVSVSTWKTTSLKQANRFLMYSLAKVDLSGWDFSKLNFAKRMFFQYKFISFELKNKDVSSLAIADYMFFGSNIKEDLSNWDLKIIMSMNYMFSRTEYEYDIERMLRNNYTTALQTRGVVFQNKAYKHLTSMRKYFYVGTEDFNENISSFSYEDKIKTGLPLKITKDENGNVLDFTKDSAIVFSKLKIKEDIKEKVNSGGIEELYPIECNEVEQRFKGLLNLALDAEYYFLSGRYEGYVLEKEGGYYNFDPVGILYVLKGDTLYSVSVTNKTMGYSFVQKENDKKRSYEKSLVLFDILERRNNTQAEKNVPKSFSQKVILFLNDLLAN